MPITKLKFGPRRGILPCVSTYPLLFFGTQLNLDGNSQPSHLISATSEWTVDSMDDFEPVRHAPKTLNPSKPNFTLVEVLVRLSEHPSREVINDHVEQNPVVTTDEKHDALRDRASARRRRYHSIATRHASDTSIFHFTKQPPRYSAEPVWDASPSHSYIRPSAEPHSMRAL